MCFAKLRVPGMLLACVAAFGSQTAAADWIVAEIDATRHMPVQGSPFQNQLHSEYMRIADAEYAAGDEKDAVYFYGRRAKIAAQGGEVDPVDPRDQRMPYTLEIEALEARQRLVSALEYGRAAAPDAAARALAAYDCWVREWCQMHVGIADCKQRFWDALSELEGVSEPAADYYIVYFDFDRSSIRADAAQVLDRLIQSVRAADEIAIRATGHADRAGAVPYNQALSERRAASVRQYLARAGISTARIRTDASGETDPRVPTPDGVREQENRRVEIVLR